MRMVEQDKHLPLLIPFRDEIADIHNSLTMNSFFAAPFAYKWEWSSQAIAKTWNKKMRSLDNYRWTRLGYDNLLLTRVSIIISISCPRSQMG